LIINALRFCVFAVKEKNDLLKQPLFIIGGYSTVFPQKNFFSE